MPRGLNYRLTEETLQGRGNEGSGPEVKRKEMGKAAQTEKQGQSGVDWPAQAVEPTGQTWSLETTLENLSSSTKVSERNNIKLLMLEYNHYWPLFFVVVF